MPHTRCSDEIIGSAALQKYSDPAKSPFNSLLPIFLLCTRADRIEQLKQELELYKDRFGKTQQVWLRVSMNHLRIVCKQAAIRGTIARYV